MRSIIRRFANNKASLAGAKSAQFHWRSLCSSVSDEGVYEEKMQATQVQPIEFYEKQGKARRYFYFIDSKGRLYLEDTQPKNIATSLKSDKFLDFFFRQLRPNPASCGRTGEARAGKRDSGITTAQSSHESSGHVSDSQLRSSKHPPFRGYPWTSPCGSEMNYVRAADTPIVFHELREVNSDPVNSSANHTGHDLVFGAGIKQVFDPARLRLSREGRLYHEIDSESHRNMGAPEQWWEQRRDVQLLRKGGGAARERNLLRMGRAGLGLVHSSVAQVLSEGMELRDDFEFAEPPAAAVGSSDSDSKFGWGTDEEPRVAAGGQGWPLDEVPREVGTIEWMGERVPIREAPCRPFLLWR